MTAHADASPSSASIWMKCPASVTLARGRARRPSAYTREGTAAHEVAERLVHGLAIPDEIEVEGEIVEVTEEMVEAVELYVGHVDALRRKSSLFLTETSLTVAGLPEPLFGTADAVGLIPEEATIEVVDLKFGKGVAVFAADNAQLRIYAIGAIERAMAAHAPDVATKVRMTIVQPRMSGKPAVDSEEISVSELLIWGMEDLFPAAQRVAEGDETEIAGAHCRWCVRAGECRAFADMTHALAVQAFDSDPAAEVRALTNDELGSFLDKADLVAAWVALVRGEASNRADLGQKIPGWKLVAKRAMRKWTDEEAVLAELMNRRVPLNDVTKLKSPTAVERDLKLRKMDGGWVGAFVSKQSSGTTLVRAADAREESLALTAESVFDAVE